jgi:hypothetical protein
MTEEETRAGELLRIVWSKREVFYKEEKAIRDLYLLDSKQDSLDYTIINKIYEQMEVVRKSYGDYIVSQNDLLTYRISRK